MTSTARSAMRLASSWMVIASGIVTSRTSFSFGSLLVSRGAALHAAAERRLRALAHLVGAQRGDERQAAARPFGRGLGRAGRTLRRSGRAHRAAGAAADHARAFVLLRLRASGRAPGAFAAAAVSPSPKRFLATSSAFFLVSSSCLRRSSSSRLRASAASRSVLLDGVALRADLGLFLGDLALFGLAQAGVAERVGAAALLFLGQGAEHDAGRLRRRRGAERQPAAGAAALAAGAARRAWRPGPRRRGRRRSLGLAVGAGDAALLDLDDHLLAAAMAEALAHHAGFGARLERQRRLSDAQRLAVRGLGLSHSVLESCQFRSRPVPPWPVPPVRKRSRRAKRAKNVSFAGPASRAACTTFDRPNAKSNWAVVKALMTAIAVGVVAPPQRAGELGDAVGAGVRRMQQADDLVAADRRLGLGEAGRDQSRLCRRSRAHRARSAPAGARSARPAPA